MRKPKKSYGNMHQNTLAVSNEIFQAVYDSPASLPGKEKWVTKDEDVRRLEELMGMPRQTIGAPLWVSGDVRNCPTCGRETNWLDIVSSALETVHAKGMITRVLLSEQKFVNVEAPAAIKHLHCFNCKAQLENIRSFKCHNWAYARPALLRVLEAMKQNKTNES